MSVQGRCAKVESTQTNGQQAVEPFKKKKKKKAHDVGTATAVDLALCFRFLAVE